MEIGELQKAVSTFIESNNLETDIEIRLLDFMSEIGELSKEVLKASDYGKKEFKSTAEWTNELGDVLFSLICVANKTEVDLELALKKALTKYKKRLEEKGEINSGN